MTEQVISILKAFYEGASLFETIENLRPLWRSAEIVFEQNPSPENAFLLSAYHSLHQELSNAEQKLPEAIYAPLVKHKRWSLKEALASISLATTEDQSKRDEQVGELYKALGESLLQDTALLEAHAVGCDRFWGSVAVQRCAAKDINGTLWALHKIEWSRILSETLTQIAPQLDEELRYREVERAWKLIAEATFPFEGYQPIYLLELVPLEAPSRQRERLDFVENILFRMDPGMLNALQDRPHLLLLLGVAYAKIGQPKRALEAAQCLPEDEIDHQLSEITRWLPEPYQDAIGEMVLTAFVSDKNHKNFGNLSILGRIAKISKATAGKCLAYARSLSGGEQQDAMFPLISALDREEQAEILRVEISDTEISEGYVLEALYSCYSGGVGPLPEEELVALLRRVLPEANSSDMTFIVQLMPRQHLAELFPALLSLCSQHHPHSWDRRCFFQIVETLWSRVDERWRLTHQEELRSWARSPACLGDALLSPLLSDEEIISSALSVVKTERVRGFAQTKSDLLEEVRVFTSRPRDQPRALIEGQEPESFRAWLEDREDIQSVDEGPLEFMQITPKLRELLLAVLSRVRPSHQVNAKKVALSFAALGEESQALETAKKVSFESDYRGTRLCIASILKKPEDVLTALYEQARHSKDGISAPELFRGGPYVVRKGYARELSRLCDGLPMGSVRLLLRGDIVEHLRDEESLRALYDDLEGFFNAGCVPAYFAFSEISPLVPLPLQNKMWRYAHSEKMRGPRWAYRQSSEEKRLLLSWLGLEGQLFTTPHLEN